MSQENDILTRIRLIDQTTKKEHYILTDQVLWNEDRTIAVATIQVPTVDGIESQDFQVSDEDIITNRNNKFQD